MSEDSNKAKVVEKKKYIQNSVLQELNLVLCDHPGQGASGEFKRDGTHVCLWLIHTVVWWKPTRCCKAIILQFKIKKKIVKKKFCVQSRLGASWI